MDAAGGYESYEFIADLYDWVVPYRERSDVDFFVDAAKKAAGPVLEVGCRAGRVLIAIAHAGIDIVGVDLSTHQRTFNLITLLFRPSGGLRSVD